MRYLAALLFSGMLACTGCKTVFSDLKDWKWDESPAENAIKQSQPAARRVMTAADGIRNRGVDVSAFTQRNQ